MKRATKITTGIIACADAAVCTAQLITTGWAVFAKPVVGHGINGKKAYALPVASTARTNRPGSQTPFRILR